MARAKSGLGFRDSEVSKACHSHRPGRATKTCSIDSWVDGGMVGGWMDGWVDVGMEGWLAGWLDGWMEKGENLELTHSPSSTTCGTLRMYSPKEEQHRMVGGPAIFFFFSDGVEGRSNPDPTSVFEIPLTAPRLFKVVIHDAHGMHRAGRHAKPAVTLASAKRGEQRRKAMVSSSRARTRWPTNAFVAILLLAILVSLSGTSSCAHSDEKRALSLTMTMDCRLLWMNPQKGFVQDPGSREDAEIWDGNRQLRRNKEQTART